MKQKFTRQCVRLLMLFVGLFALSSSGWAANFTGGSTIYLTFNVGWDIQGDNARLVADFYGDNGNYWQDFSYVSGSGNDKIFSCKVPTDKTYHHVNILRLDPNNADNRWGAQYKIPAPTSSSNNLLTIKNINDKKDYDSSIASWSAYSSGPTTYDYYIRYWNGGTSGNSNAYVKVTLGVEQEIDASLCGNGDFGIEVRTSGSSAQDSWYMPASGSYLAAGQTRTFDVSTSGSNMHLPDVKSGKFKFTLYSTNNSNQNKPSSIKITAPASTSTGGDGGSNKVQIDGDFTAVGLSGWGTLQNTVEYNDNQYFYTFTPTKSGNIYFQFLVDNTRYYPNWNENPDCPSDVTYNEAKASTNDNGNSWSKNLTSGKTYTIMVYLNYDGVKRVTLSEGKPAVWEPRDLPVYPNGVHNATEFTAYPSNEPIYYLQSRVLNDNRITPEYQMQKVDENNYELLFTYRNSISEGSDSFTRSEQYIWVEGFDNKNAKSKQLCKTTTNELTDQKTLREGRLYKAKFNKSNNTLTFEDQGQQMPFISMIGNTWKQRTADGKGYKTPAGKNTNNGFQESWIQYNSKGQVARDRDGNVMYNTMWPPKHNIDFQTEFTLDGTTYNFGLQTDQLVLVPGETKTGEDWKKDPMFAKYDKSGNTPSNPTAKKGLALDDKTSYTLYRVQNMWINGDVKIWTGWGGTTIGGTANWSSHANWGHYAESTSATKIDPEYTIPLSNREGDVKFSEPTYFKYVDFFYSNTNPNDKGYSVLFTELAQGGAEIAAMNDATYSFGYYRPALTAISNVGNIKSVIIDCYQADGNKEFMGNVYTYSGEPFAANQFASKFDNDASGAIGDVTADGTVQRAKYIIYEDSKNFPNGDYIYKMKVVLANDEVLDEVESNPFTIYNSQIKTPVDVYQLVEIGENHYVTFKGKNGVPQQPIYDIVVNNGQIKSTRITQEVSYGSNAHTFTDLVLVAGQGHLEADEITGYQLYIDGVTKDAADNKADFQTEQDNRFIRILRQEKLENTKYELVMNYTMNFDASGNAASQSSSSTKVPTTFALTIPSPRLGEGSSISVDDVKEGDLTVNSYRGATRAVETYNTAGNNDYKGARLRSLSVTVPIELPNATSQLLGLAKVPLPFTITDNFELVAEATGVVTGTHNTYTAALNLSELDNSTVNLVYKNQNIMNWIKNTNRPEKGNDDYVGLNHNLEMTVTTPAGMSIYDRFSEGVTVTFDPVFGAPNLNGIDGTEIGPDHIQGFVFYGLTEDGKNVAEQLYVTAFPKMTPYTEARLGRGDKAVLDMNTFSNQPGKDAYYSFGAGWGKDGRNNQLLGTDGLGGEPSLISHEFLKTNSAEGLDPEVPSTGGPQTFESAILIQQKVVEKPHDHQLEDVRIGIGHTYFFQVANDQKATIQIGDGKANARAKAAPEISDATVVAFIPVHDEYTADIQTAIYDNKTGTPTGVDQVEMSSSVIVGQGYVDMNGTEGRLFSVDGSLIYSGNGRVDLNAGVYILNFGGRSVKVLVK